MKDKRQRVQQFLRRQVRDIRDGGTRVLLRKVCMAGEAVLAVPIVLLVRLLRPLVRIRFGGLPTAGMGTLAATLEIYLCEREAGLHGRRVIDLFCCSQPVSNQQLKAMWERTVPVSRFTRSLERVNRWLPGGRGNQIPWRRTQAYDLYGVLAHRKPHLSFTPEEERYGQAELQRLGIPSHTPFVCCYARDSAYWSQIGQKRPDEQLNDHRNSDIHTHRLAMEELSRRGYVVLRMGAIVNKPLRTTHPKIIDYATTARTDFLDVYLCAKCRFFLGDSGGLASVPMVFRRPVAMVNSIPLEYAWSWGPDDLFIPKRLWLRAERRFLTFPEIMRQPVKRFMRASQYEQAGIEVVDNTPEEITALAIEMDERLKGTWRTTEEDEELQRQFWALLQSSPYHGNIRSRIGAEFLRQHRALLDSPAARVHRTV